MEQMKHSILRPLHAVLLASALLIISAPASSKTPKRKESGGSGSFRAAIEARGEEFRACFEREPLRENQDSPSKSESAQSRSVETHFVINPEGKAILVRVTRSVPKQPKVENCIVRQIGRAHV